MASHTFWILAAVVLSLVVIAKSEIEKRSLGNEVLTLSCSVAGNSGNIDLFRVDSNSGNSGAIDFYGIEEKRATIPPKQGSKLVNLRAQLEMLKRRTLDNIVKRNHESVGNEQRNPKKRDFEDAEEMKNVKYLRDAKNGKRDFEDTEELKKLRDVGNNKRDFETIEEFEKARKARNVGKAKRDFEKFEEFESAKNVRGLGEIDILGRVSRDFEDTEELRKAMNLRGLGELVLLGRDRSRSNRDFEDTEEFNKELNKRLAELRELRNARNLQELLEKRGRHNDDSKYFSIEERDSGMEAAKRGYFPGVEERSLPADEEEAVAREVERSPSELNTEERSENTAEIQKRMFPGGMGMMPHKRGLFPGGGMYLETPDKRLFPGRIRAEKRGLFPGGPYESSPEKRMFPGGMGPLHKRDPLSTEERSPVFYDTNDLQKRERFLGRRNPYEEK